MPLNKTIEINNSGVSATYWVVTEVKFDLVGILTSAKLSGYLSSAAFASGKGSFAERSFVASTPGSFGTTTGLQMITTVQNFIKTLPEFIGATDAA